MIDMCFRCGEYVQIGRRRHHAICALRPLRRIRWKGHLDGWHDGYHLAITHPDHPLTRADVEDYGTGWAAAVRSGVRPSDEAIYGGSP